MDTVLYKEAAVLVVDLPPLGVQYTIYPRSSCSLLGIYEHRYTVCQEGTVQQRR